MKEKKIKRPLTTQIPLGLLNGFMRALLRSPLHRAASKSVLIISFAGRRSGRTITTPISYLREGDTLTLFTGAPWRKNLAGGALVRLWMAGREYTGWAEVTEKGQEAVCAGLERFLRGVPGDARFYGVTLDKYGAPDPAQVAEAAQRVSMITVKLSARGCHG